MTKEDFPQKFLKAEFALENALDCYNQLPWHLKIFTTKNAFVGAYIQRIIKIYNLNGFTATIPDNQVKTVSLTEVGCLYREKQNLGLASAKNEGGIYDYESGKEIDEIVKKAEKLFLTMPKSYRKNKERFIENYVSVELGRI